MLPNYDKGLPLLSHLVASGSFEGLEGYAINEELAGMALAPSSEDSVAGNGRGPALGPMHQATIKNKALNPKP